MSEVCKLGQREHHLHLLTKKSEFPTNLEDNEQVFQILSLEVCLRHDAPENIFLCAVF